MGQKKVGTVTIDITAGTAQMVIDMEKANATVVNFGRKGLDAGKQFGEGMKEHVIPPAIAASAAIRSLEGNPGLRAAERFLSIIPGMSVALQNAFPVLGAVAFGAVLLKLGEEATKFYKEFVDGAARAKLALGELVTTSRLQNDALAITNDKLENEIAKLTGKPQNGLKLALDEAIESANKLGQSLESALKSLYKVLEEQQSGFLNSLLTGQVTTKYIKETIGGPTGVTGAIGAVGDLEFAAQGRLDKAKTIEEANTIRKEIRDEAKRILGEAEGTLRSKLASATLVNPERNKEFGADAGPFASAKSPLNEVERAQLQQALRAIEQQKRAIDLRYRNSDLQQKASGLRAAEGNEKLERPFEKAIAGLDAKLKGLDEELKAVNGTAEEQAIAKGMKAAGEEIAKVNAALKRVHGTLSDTQELQITSREIQIAQNEAYLKFGTRLEGEIEKTKERIKAEELLTAAIGKGYEATKRASVEAGVLAKVGTEKYGNPLYGIEVGKVRTQEIDEFEAKHRRQVKNTIDGLETQIQLEKSLAAVQEQGKDAVERVAFAYKLRELYSKGASAEEIKAEVELFNAQKANSSASNLANLKLVTAEAIRMTDAFASGAKQIRETQLALKLESAQRSGATPAELEAIKREEAAQHQKQISELAGKAVNSSKDQLESLREQRKVIEGITLTDENRLAIAAALKANTLEQNKILRDQVLATGSARDGFAQFFRDIAAQSKSAAEQIYEGMTKALDGINDSLAKLATGGKANWKKLFQGLAEDGVKQSLRDLEKLAFGGLSGGLGGVIQQQIGHGGVLGTGVGTGGSGGKGGGLGGVFGKVFGLNKRDGQTPESSIYVSLVADSKGGAIPFSSGGLKADPSVNYYIGSITANGDVSEIYRTFGRALSAFHGKAVNDSVRANTEALSRIPGGPGNGSGGF